MIIDLNAHLRCKRCRRLPRGKLQKRNRERYEPFCSYNCQQWWNLEEAQRYINENLREQFMEGDA